MFINAITFYLWVRAIIVGRINFLGMAIILGESIFFGIGDHFWKVKGKAAIALYQRN
ncbi:MAG: hypothetical protein VKL42_20915 [Snowella sp.]|nr:hypothetical protein [Snowella sp.]